MPQEEARVDFYGSQYGGFASRLYAEVREATYDRDIGQNGWLTAVEQDLLIDWLDLGPDDRLLDIACGSGGPTLRIAEVTGCRVDGIDLHADAIDTARTAADERGLASRASFHHGDGGADLPFESESFAAVTCIDAINHLAPGGRGGRRRERRVSCGRARPVLSGRTGRVRGGSRCPAEGCARDRQPSCSAAWSTATMTGFREAL